MGSQNAPLLSTAVCGPSPEAFCLSSCPEPVVPSPSLPDGVRRLPPTFLRGPADSGTVTRSLFFSHCYEDPSCCRAPPMGQGHRSPSPAQSPRGFPGPGWLGLHPLPSLWAASEGTFQLKLNHIPPSLPSKDGIAGSSCDTTGSSGSSWFPKEGLGRGSGGERRGAMNESALRRSEPEGQTLQQKGQRWDHRVSELPGASEGDNHTDGKTRVPSTTFPEDPGRTPSPQP